jgi:hypothetical protein
VADGELVGGETKWRLEYSDPGEAAVNTSELLARLSATLKADIGPAVSDEYPRTQAFMASVILERLSKQVALEVEHARAEAEDLDRLLADLGPLIAGGPHVVTEALSAVTDLESLSPLVDALYVWGWHEPAVGDALSMIRPILRRDIDRRMEIAT